MRGQRRRVFGLAATIAVGVAYVGAQQTAPSQQPRPVFRGGTTLVQVDAYPTRDNRIVEGLTAGDFEVFEDGKPQKIEDLEFIRIEPNTPDVMRRDPNTQEEGNALAADPRNRVFVIYLDYYHMNLVGSHATRRPLVDFLNRMLAVNDLFGVMTPSLRPRDLMLGRQTQTLEEQLARYWYWGESGFTTDREKMALEEKCYPIAIPWARYAMDRVLSGLDGLVTYLGGLREARKVIVLMTRGWTLPEDKTALANTSARNPGVPTPGVDPRGRITMDPNSGRGQSGDKTWCSTEQYRLLSMDFQQRQRDLIQAANRNNVTFYPVNPAGLETAEIFDASQRGVPTPGAVMASMDAMRDREDSMRVLGDNTDGFAIVNTNDLNAGFRKISDDVSAYYVLGYYSTNTKFDGKFRRIEVKMKAPGVKVKARRGYFSPEEGAGPNANAARVGAALPTAKPSSPVEDAFSALSRLRPTAELYSRGTATATELILATEIATGQLLGGRFDKGADVEFVVTDAAGAEVAMQKARIEPSTRGVLVRVPVPTDSAGPWRVGTKVTIGAESLQDRFDVARPATKILGDPMVFRALPSGSSPLRAVGDMFFRRTERIHIEWPLLTAIDAREGRLLGRNALPIPIPVTVTERDVNGQRLLAADLNLAPLTEADYVIEVTAGAGTESEKRFLAIRVVR
jgi:VWFA-related protein